MAKVLEDIEGRFEYSLRSEHDISVLLWKKRIDEELIPNVMDPDSWQHEDSLLNHSCSHEGECSCDSTIAEQRMYGGTPPFAKECNCKSVDGKNCIVCCTMQDLMSFPQELLRSQRITVTPFPGRPGDYNVRMPNEFAEQLGFDFE